MRKILAFLRVTDPYDDMLSLTNIALIVCIVKIAIARDASMVDMGTLLCALANYSAKKIINRDSPSLVSPGVQAVGGASPASGGGE